VSSIALALVLMVGPRIHPGPEGVIRDGPAVPSSPEAVDRWLRRSDAVRVRADTRWTGRTIPLAHGGWVLLLRESYRGHPVAGARLAVRVGPGGRLRQVVGTGLSPALQLEASEPWPGDGRADLWWPTKAGLVPARIEDTDLSFVGGQPWQERRYVDVRTGEVLAAESLIDEIIVPIQGWPENPLTTPELMQYDVSVADLDPIALEDSVFKVVACNWNEAIGKCDPVVSPTALEPDGFPSTPPPLDDAAGHASWDDPYAGLQFMQFAARAEAKLAQWGWDPYAWDELDCSWQQTQDPADCRVWALTNVLNQDAEGVFPYSGAFYVKVGKIYLGQGYHADAAYDGDIVVHEIGHHITWSLGNSEPPEGEGDPSRSITDFPALNEASSDFLARMIGPNDHIYEYFSAIEPGTYVGPRIRDVSIPFRCPQNVVGESHMDGRIWISAVIDVRWALEDAGLAGADAYAMAYYGALAAIRQIPREQTVQLPDARAILLDEIELSFGPQAHDIAREIFDARGVGRCDYVIDLRDEPTVTGLGDPANDPLDARFLVVPSHPPAVDPAVVDAHPFAPPLQHRVTLADNEVGVALRYRPNVWRPKRPVDEVELKAAALVKAGEELVWFTFDDEGLVVNDAELRFESVADGELERIVIDGLEPGQTYTIALVSLSTIVGDKLTMEDMSWELLEDADPGGDGDGDGGSGSESGDAGTSDTGGDTAVDTSDGGCACSTSDTGGVPWLGVFGLVLIRRRTRAAGGS
jgi:MYXO-CTERM domain-containing protein